MGMTTVLDAWACPRRIGISELWEWGRRGSPLPLGNCRSDAQLNEGDPEQGD